MRLSYGERHGIALNLRNSQLTFAGWLEKLSSSCSFLLESTFHVAHVHTRTRSNAIIPWHCYLARLAWKFSRAFHRHRALSKFNFLFPLIPSPSPSLHAFEPSSPTLYQSFRCEGNSRERNVLCDLFFCFCHLPGVVSPPCGSWLFALVSLSRDVARKIIGKRIWDYIDNFVVSRGNYVHMSLRDSFKLTHRIWNMKHLVRDRKYNKFQLLFFSTSVF